MEDIITGMLLQMLDISSILPTDFFDKVNASLSGYMGGDVLNKVDVIMKDTVFAIGASLLTLFMLIELVTMVNRFNSDGGLMGVRLPANVLIRFGIYSFLFCNLNKVMLGIQSIAIKIGSSITETAIDVDTSELKTITDTFKDMDIFGQIGSFILIILAFCITQIIVMIIQTVVSFRIFELFIYYIFAPIPLATLASQEFRSVAFNYLKGFLAISLQSAVILASFKLYNLITVSSIPQTVPEGLSAWDIFMQIIVPMTGYLAVLAVAVMSSGRIAKSIVNAM